MSCNWILTHNDDNQSWQFVNLYRVSVFKHFNGSVDVFVVENQDVLEHLHSLAASIVWIIKEHMIRVLLNRLTSIALAYILARTDDTPRDSIKPNTKHIVELSVKQKYPRRLITIYSCVPSCIFTWVLSLLGRFFFCCLMKTAIFTILWRYVHSDW